jgi:hypothetical protein
LLLLLSAAGTLLLPVALPLTLTLTLTLTLLLLPDGAAALVLLPAATG